MKKHHLIVSVLLGACCCIPNESKRNRTPSVEEWERQEEAAEWEDEAEEYGEEAIEYAGDEEGWEVERVEENWYKRYKASKDRNWLIKHTDLKLFLDFEEQRIDGTAHLHLSPYFYSQDTLVLDAKKLNINSVLDIEKNQSLYFKYNKDSMAIVVFLYKTVSKGETLQLKIKYSTSQSKNRFRNNGAIAGDDGFYFINSKMQRNIPRQFWTQGETESNSRWFPTIDAPNQKHTQRLEVTVPDTMKVLSNGKKIGESSKSGLKTVIWEQKKPHAVYLTMLAVSNWTIVQDNWKGMPVNYWVEKPYEKQAKKIFGNTPEMMEFFSDYTGVDYPWDKYSQVVVRDFVSGAMENTSATVHMESLQQSDGDLLDHSLEDYISHELFHQWFGDYVTAESWGNITLNESFATYGEYLWQEHKYGQIAADETLYGFRSSYDNWGEHTGNTLLRHEYLNTNEMFDVTSYQKGALILHMLRHEVGDKAFKESIKLYLTRYAYKNAEVEQLRLCFEEVTGKDLAWFFNQWYKRATYPIYDVSCEKDSSGMYHVDVYQDQGDYSFTYGKMNLKYSVKGKVIDTFFTVNASVFRFNLGKIEPDWVVMNPKNTNLGHIHYPESFIDGILDFRKLYLAYSHVQSPSVKSSLWAEFENRTGGFVDPEQLRNTKNGEEESFEEVEYNSEFKAEQDSLRVIMIRQAIESKSRVLAQNVLFPYFNHTNNASLAGQVGLEIFSKAVQDKSNPSGLRNRCFNIVADLTKDTNYIYSYVNDPSIAVANSAISRIWKWNELQSRLVNGLKNPEVDIAKRWFTQCLYVNTAGSENYDYYILLKQHPFFNELNKLELTREIFEYSNALEAFAKDLLKEGNPIAITLALNTLDSRINRLGFNENKGVKEEVDGLKKVQSTLKSTLEK